MNQIANRRIVNVFSAMALFFASALLISSCSSDKDEEQQGPEQEETSQGTLADMKLGDVSDSGCLTTRADVIEDAEAIVLKKEGDVVTCELRNYKCNCDTQGFDVVTDIAKGSSGATDTLFVDIAPIQPNTADCTCPMTVYFTLRNVPDGSYHLQLQWFSGTVTLKDKETVELKNDFQSAAIDGLTYQLQPSTGHAVVTSPSKYDGVLSIPSVITHDGLTYTVTGISGDAFYGCATLTGVVLPRTLSAIVNIDGCQNPFTLCSALQDITVESGNPHLCSVDDVLYDKQRCLLYCYPAKAGRSEYAVPAGVTSVSAFAFSGNASLRTIDLPTSMVGIGKMAFANCILDHLYLRGGLDEKRVGMAIFHGMGTTTTIHVPQAQVETFKTWYFGTVEPL